MNSLPSLLYSEDQELLRTAVRELLERQCGWERVLARTDEPHPDVAGVWDRLGTELGCAGLAAPESVGGAGAGWGEVAVVAEEVGRHAADLPYVTTQAALALAIAVGATDVVAEIAAGAVATIVVPFASARLVNPDSGAVRQQLISQVAGALDTDGASPAPLLLVPTAGTLATIRSGASVFARPCFDSTRRLVDVDITAAAAERVLLAAEDVALARNISLTLLAAEQLGIAERCLEMTVEYMGQRRQFARLLGSYQALRHRLADLWTEIAMARATARYAAACAGDGAEDLPVAAAVAMIACSEAAVHAAQECIQLHGGIGFTWEHPAHLYLKRARANALAYGSPSRQRSRLGTLVNLPRPVAPGPTVGGISA